MTFWRQLQTLLASPPRKRPKPRPGGSHPRRPSAGRPRDGGTPSSAVIAYHGTPSLTNAASIFKDGFLIGGGNALGDGIYLSTNRDTAKAYAGSGGCILKCAVRAGKTAMWNPTLQRQYDDWCRQRGAPQNNSAKTAFLLSRGYGALRSGDVLVVLRPQYANPAAYKKKDGRIRVLGAYRPDGQRIRV